MLCDSPLDDAAFYVGVARNVEAIEPQVRPVQEHRLPAMPADGEVQHKIQAEVVTCRVAFNTQQAMHHCTSIIALASTQLMPSWPRSHVICLTGGLAHDVRPITAARVHTQIAQTRHLPHRYWLRSIRRLASGGVVRKASAQAARQRSGVAPTRRHCRQTHCTAPREPTGSRSNTAASISSGSSSWMGAGGCKRYVASTKCAVHSGCQLMRGKAAASAWA